MRTGLALAACLASLPVGAASAADPPGRSLAVTIYADDIRVARLHQHGLPASRIASSDVLPQTPQLDVV